MKKPQVDTPYTGSWADEESRRPKVDRSKESMYPNAVTIGPCDLFGNLLKQRK